MLFRMESGIWLSANVFEGRRTAKRAAINRVRPGGFCRSQSSFISQKPPWHSRTTMKHSSIIAVLSLHTMSSAFLVQPQSPAGSSITRLAAKPKRLEENTAGVVYVNDKCINCAACNGFAPETFERSQTRAAHIVYQQPQTQDEVEKARAALLACPVAAIRLETKADRQHVLPSDAKDELVWSEDDQALVDQMALLSKETKPFPRQFLGDVPDVYWVGHHNAASFGAIPYLLKAKVDGEDKWIMVDTPKFSKASVEVVTSLTGPSGPDFLFMTHIDDTADQEKWADEFSDLVRIIHSTELQNNWPGTPRLDEVEVILEENDAAVAYKLDGTPLAEWSTRASNDDSDVVLLHTPGHSRGSMTLYKRPSLDSPGILFTGDTYAYSTRNGGSMSIFPQYGNNLRRQTESVQKYLDLDWDLVAPGHGIARDYRGVGEKRKLQAEEMESAFGVVNSR